MSNPDRPGQLLYRTDDEVRWRDPGVEICLSCPIGAGGRPLAEIDAICAQADEPRRYGPGLEKPQCPLVLAKWYLGNSAANLRYVEPLARQMLNPDRSESLRWYERALQIEADRRAFVEKLREAA